MPVVDLVDVPEDDFVFSFHVVRDAFFLDPLHEALQDQGEQVRQISAKIEKCVCKLCMFNLLGHFLFGAQFPSIFVFYFLLY